MQRRIRRFAALAALCLPASASGATYTLTLEEAVQMALAHSPEARRIDLELRRSTLDHRGARRTLWPDLALDLVAPEYSQQFDVAPLPSAPGDSFASGEPTRIVYAKTTTTSRNASGALNYRQLLPWRGSFSAGGNVVYHDEETSPEGARASRNDYQVSASIGIDVPLLGDEPDRRALRRADLEWRRASERTRAARADLEFETVSGYLDLLHAELVLDVARQEAVLAVRAQEVARRKLASGLLADVDRMRTDLFHAEREARLAAAEAELARARDAFKVHLGIEVGDSLVLAEPLRPLAPGSPVEIWLQRARDNRSEIGLLEDELEVLDRDRRARRAHRPDIGLTMRYGGGASDAALDEALRALAANDLSLRLGIRVPLWDSGRVALEDESESLGLELQELEIERTRAQIELEVRDAVRQMEEADRRYALLAAANELAAEVLRITSERYERGLVDTETLLDSQNDAATSRLQTTAALLDLYRARARLRLVTLSEEE